MLTNLYSISDHVVYVMFNSYLVNEIKNEGSTKPEKAFIGYWGRYGASDMDEKMRIRMWRVRTMRSADKGVKTTLPTKHFARTTTVKKPTPHDDELKTNLGNGF